MSGGTGGLEATAGVIVDALWRASVQGGIAILFAWAVCGVWRRIPGDLRCWLWRLACWKLLLALVWVTPIDLPLLPVAQTRVTEGPLPSGPRAPIQAARPRRLGEDHLRLTASPRSLDRPRAGRATAVALLWLLGATGCGARLLARRRRLRDLRRRATPMQDPIAVAAVARICRELGLRRAPELLRGDVPTPLLMGRPRPAILLPRTVEVGSTELRWILAHELAHARRSDLAWSWLPAMIGCLFFFHPLAWLAERELRLAQEIACDTLALQITRASAGDCAEMLVSLAARRPRTGVWDGSAAAVSGSCRNLERRLSVLKFVGSTPRPRGALWIAAAAALALTPVSSPGG